MEMINFWGSIASIIGLAIVFIGYTFNAVGAAKKQQQEQERYSVNAKKKISQLALKATSHRKRQDIHIFVNSLLSERRHLENRMRIQNTLIHFTYLVQLFFSFITIAWAWNYEGTFIMLLKIVIIISVIIGGFANYKLNKIVDCISKLNDSYSEGYLDIVMRHINENYVE